MDKYLVLAMFLQVLFPFVVMLRLFNHRVKALKAKEVSISSYRTNTASFNEDIVIHSNHYNNLFQMPLLFLVASLLYLHFRLVDFSVLFIAYSFVVTRLIHSFIHLGNNNVIHRAQIFGLSGFVILIYWMLLVGKLFL